MNGPFDCCILLIIVSYALYKTAIFLFYSIVPSFDEAKSHLFLKNKRT